MKLFVANQDGEAQAIEMGAGRSLADLLAGRRADVDANAAGDDQHAARNAVAEDEDDV